MHQPQSLTIYPLSETQKSRWLQYQLKPESAGESNTPFCARVRGLTPDRLEEALNLLVRRHPMLRAAFEIHQGELAYRILEDVSVRVTVVDVGAESDEVLRHRVVRDCERAFDVTRPPLLAAYWYARAGQDPVMLIFCEHLAVDGWSYWVVLDELGFVLAGEPLEALPPQDFAHYVQWQQKWLEGPVAQAQRRHWQEVLSGELPVLQFPVGKRGAKGSQVIDPVVPESLARRLNDLADRQGSGLFAIMLSAYQVLLHRYSGLDDIIIGSSLPGRTRSKWGRVVGEFVNSVALRCQIDGALTIREHIRHTQKLIRQGIENQKYPFAKVLESLGVARNPEVSPVFQAMMTFQNTRMEGGLDKLWVAENDEEAVSWGGGELRRFPYPLIGDSSVAFTLDVLVIGDRMRCPFRFDTAQVDEALMQQMIRHYFTLLEAFADDDSQTVGELQLLSPAEREQVLNGFNATARDFPREALIHQLFEAQAARTPDAPAVEHKGVTLSYHELNCRANRLARHLRVQGVQAGEFVALCAQRSLDMVVGLLAILKAGGAYIPLDTAYPEDRLAYILGDSQPLLILADDAGQAILEPLQLATRLINLERQGEAWAALSAEAPACLHLNSSDLAYVIYTSGSTGHPKGVMIEHRSLVNYVLDAIRWFELTPSDRVLQQNSLNFDLSLEEMLPALLSGACLVLATELFGSAPLSEHRKLGLSFVHMTAAHWHTLVGQWSDAPLQALQYLQGVRLVNVTGDALSAQKVRAWESIRPESTGLINTYGPTEATVSCTATRLAGEPEGVNVTIGKPFANTGMYILDGKLQPVPIGVSGELYIAGVQVGRGYLNRPELTAERFISDPFSADPQARLYKTGDLGRWLPDGSIEYLGRNDFQVKIRGFRIELGEIEAKLAACAGVKEAVVLAREDAPGDKRLVAYLTAQPGAELEPSSLRAALLQELAEYMVPSGFVALEAFPLTPNGKLDRKALPAPDGSQLSSRTYAAPEGEAETTLAAIWSELLGVERVGRHDNFFELGGHSLLAVTLVERMRQAGWHSDIRQLFGAADLAALAASLSGDAALVAAPANGIPAEGCAAITPEMVTLTALSQAQIDAIAEQVPGGMANIQDIYPLAPLQEGILFHHLLGGEGDAYLVPTLIRLADREKARHFIANVQQAVDRHDILRTGVLWQGLPEPVQVVWRQAPVQVETVALDPADGPLAQQLEARYHPRRYRIDVRQAPLIKAIIAESGTGECWMLLLVHHLIMDNVGLALLVSEIRQLQQGQGEALPSPLPFRQFVAQARLGVGAAEHEAYFRAQLGEVDEPTLPFGLQGNRGEVGELEEARLSLSPTLAEQLRRQARRLGVSVACLAHLAWGQVLARASGRTQVVFGTVLFGRLQGGAGADRALGLFINTLPLKLEIGAATAREAVKQTQQALTSLLRHEHASLALAQRCSGVAAPQPLFSALLNYRRSTGDDVMETVWDGIEIVSSQDSTHYPLTLSVDDLGIGLALTAQTLASVGAARVCAMMETALASLAAALESDSGEAVRRLDVLPAAERRQLLETFNDTAADYPRGELIHRLFEAQAASRPEAEALRHGEASLSYGDLNRRANQLAHRLIGLGVGPEARVGICVERGLDMVVGLLGILKAGGAYVPLDPSYPAERLSYMLEDSAPVVVLTQASLAEKLSGSTPWLLLDAPEERAKQAAQSEANPAVTGLDSGKAAYVIYTSGSTGRPKGVVNEHEGVVNRLWWAQETYRLTTADRVLQKTPFGFDVSVWEFFLPLLAGARLVMADPEGHKDPHYLRQVIETAGITTLHFVPSMLQSFVSLVPRGSCPTLKRILCSGEALPHALQTQCLSHFPHSELHNLYGPTEAAIDVTAWPCSAAGPSSFVPIGKPISNIQIHILDGDGQLAPLGVAGELYIGGAGVARGYLNRPELTAERFIADPYSADPQARLYKTGDLGRWLPDGSIEYLGRNDFQVKIRGFRIELGEIEAKLAACAGVKEAVVLAREDAPGDKRLVAYLTAQPGATLEAAALRAALSQELAEYMVPSGFVVLEAFPLTPNGKLDRKALPAPDGSQLSSRAYAAPEGEAETTLAAIWSELLGVERVGRHDNFFELGGHSLLAVTLVERMRQAGLHSDIRQLFGAADLAALAASLSGDSALVAAPANGIPAEGCEAITPEMVTLTALSQAQIDAIAAQVPGGMANIQDIYPLVPLQEGILFHHLLGGEGDAYLLYDLLAFDSGERLNGFLASLQQVVDRHDILRTGVLWQDLPEPVQVVWRKAPVQVETVALDPADGPLAQQLEARYHPRRHRIDVRQAPLLRGFVAAEAGTGRQYLQLLYHHLAIDHTTLERLLDEVRLLQQGQGVSLPPSLPFRQFVAQARLGVGAAEHEAYFRAQLGEVDEPTLPFGLSGTQEDGSRQEEWRTRLPMALADQLRQQARRLGVSVACLAHLAWGQVLARASGRTQVVFGTVLFGRLQGGAGADRALGLFINTLPLKLEIGAATAREAVKQTQQALTSLLRHEHASLALAQRCSGVAAPQPLFSALLNYRHSSGYEGDAPDWDGVEVLVGEERTNYPLILSVDDLGAGLALTAQTLASVGAARVCAMMETALASLAAALAADSGEAVRRLDVLPAAERRQLLETFNDTASDYPRGELIHRLFEAQAASRPEAEALRHGEASLSYGELNRRANQLAHRLIGLGVEPGDRVALDLPRGADLLIAIVGVLKSGAAYLPLDEGLTAERRQWLLADSGAKLSVDAAWLATPGTWPEESPAVAGDAESVAYLMYTSGSTGEPKGVLAPHRGITRLVCGNRYAAFQADDRIAWAANPAFDASTLEIWGALAHGASLVAIDKDTLLSAEALGARLQRDRITILWLTAGLFQRHARGLGAALSGLRYLMVGGDVVDPRVAAQVRRDNPPAHLLNCYGPTETTTFAATHEIGAEAETAASLPIGKPIGNTRIYILDGDGQLAPLGVAGEIHIGGAGVARGYLNRPELTAERFIADPYSADPQARLYKTGDLGRWLPDGSIEYLGRNDFQVKIRGFRIELGEIEAKLAACAGVKEAVVLAREDAPGDKRLVAYLTAQPGATLEAAALRAALSQELAEYMVPSGFVVLEAFPLTPNGKLDRKALPAPDGSQLSSRAYAAPEGEAETALAAIWSELLGVERVGRHDNFFELGGHSLLAVTLVERMRQAGLHSDIRQLFGAADLAALAKTVSLGPIMEEVDLFAAPVLGQSGEMIEEIVL